MILLAVEHGGLDVVEALGAGADDFVATPHRPREVVARVRARLLDVHVKRLRGRIEDDPARPTKIVTVRGVGYRYEGNGA